VLPKVAIAGMWQETNTYSSRHTSMADYLDFELVAGADMVTCHRHSQSVIGGFLAHLGDRAAPALSVAAWPAGLTPERVFSDLLAMFEDELFKCRGSSGVLLNLHGAMVAEGFPDVELEVVRAVRRVLGDLPIVAVLDFHANPSLEFLAQVDALVSYETYPHVDMFDRGREAAQMLDQILISGERWKVSAHKLPLLTSPMSQGSGSDPIASIIDRARSTAGVKLSAMPGFVYSDVARGGFTVAASGRLSAGREAGDELAQFAWAMKDRFSVSAVPTALGVRSALEATGTIVLADVGDNIGGGSGGDGTEVLREMLRVDAKSAVVVISDSSTAALAHSVSIGDEIEVSLGGKLELQQGGPIGGRARVVSTSSGKYTATGAWMGGHVFDMGPSAVLKIGDVDVIVTSIATPPFHRELLTSQGVDPTGYKIIVAKGALAWQDSLSDVAAGAQFLDTRGSTPARPESLIRASEPESGNAWAYPRSTS
jgi:microcystin degradation protein MlrC